MTWSARASPAGASRSRPRAPRSRRRADVRLVATANTRRNSRQKTRDEARLSPSRIAAHERDAAMGAAGRRGHAPAGEAPARQPMTTTAQERAPWAPMTSDISMSAVLEGPETNEPQPGRSMRIRS